MNRQWFQPERFVFSRNDMIIGCQKLQELSPTQPLRMLKGMGNPMQVDAALPFPFIFFPTPKAEPGIAQTPISLTIIFSIMVKSHQPPNHGKIPPAAVETTVAKSNPSVTLIIEQRGLNGPEFLSHKTRRLVPEQPGGL